MPTVKCHVCTLLLCVFALTLSSLGSADAAEPRKIPVILDTDIGTSIDDAFAFSLLVACEQYDLRGVTTCGSNAQDRAWMLCRFLTALDMKNVPVAYGRDPQPQSKIDWQIQYRRHPAVVWNRTTKPVAQPADELMAKLLSESKEPIVLMCLGPLTNIARLLEKHPDTKKKIEAIVLMGGAVKVGYDGTPPVEAEWNIQSDIKAAQKVFSSGIPLTVVPLDATHGLKLSAQQREKLFSAFTPLTYELQSLYQLWEGDDATLHDPAAVRVFFNNHFFEMQSLRLSVDDKGITRVAEGKPNAHVAMRADRDAFLNWYVDEVSGYGKSLLPAPPKNVSKPIPQRGLPGVVQAFEDYDNDIEKRWWMTGKLETKDLPQGSRRACRAVLTQDYDGRMGDRDARYKAVIFNPVPGPPVGSNSRLSFRYRLSGTDTLRIQLFSLSNGYHRYLSLKGLPQDEWTDATVDMTQMRRPDGSGGPLAKDERIDDIQFYIDPRADLVIDTMILYDEAPQGEKRPFPKRLLFTGWFDTGRQGQEWPGEFEIVPHEKPRTWDAAKSVTNKETGRPWIKLNLRGQRRLAPDTHLRFRYRLKGADAMKVALVNSKSKQQAVQSLAKLNTKDWDEAELSFQFKTDQLAEFPDADEIQFLLPEGAELLIDDLLLFEPGNAHESK